MVGPLLILATTTLLVGPRRLLATAGWAVLPAVVLMVVSQADLSEKVAPLTAREIWTSINRPNLVENILPARPRTPLVHRNNSGYSFQWLRLHRIWPRRAISSIRVDSGRGPLN